MVLQGFTATTLILEIRRLAGALGRSRCRHDRQVVEGVFPGAVDREFVRDIGHLRIDGTVVSGAIGTLLIFDPNVVISTIV